MDEVLIRNALNSMLEATEDDATPIIRRLARVQARAALDTLASAPAGDGVEDEKIVSRAVEQVMRGFSFETLTGPENLRARLSLCARQAVHDTIAALARPRAAVGERSREAIARIVDPEPWQDVSGEDTYPAMLRRIDERKAAALAKADAILALQSPPAKVEG